ncbi:MAG: hypothetical protein ABSF87_05890 [Xanthobacteraceae bacterium]|jgi:hypothetical protein
MFEKQVAADAAKPKSELEAEKAEANRLWRQRQYFRQVFGGDIGDRRQALWGPRQIDWSRMP